MHCAAAARSAICQEERDEGGGMRETVRDWEDIVCVMIDNHNKTRALRDTSRARRGAAVKAVGIKG